MLLKWIEQILTMKFDLYYSRIGKLIKNADILLDIGLKFFIFGNEFSMDSF